MNWKQELNLEHTASSVSISSNYDKSIHVVGKIEVCCGWFVLRIE